MRIFLRILAVLMIVTVILAWAAMGAHLGWSQNSVPSKSIDPITEIEFTEYRAGFVPGVEYLAVGIIGAAVIFAVTFLPSKNKKHRS